MTLQKWFRSNVLHTASLFAFSLVVALSRDNQLLLLTAQKLRTVIRLSQSKSTTVRPLDGLGPGVAQFAASGSGRGAHLPLLRRIGVAGHLQHQSSTEFDVHQIAQIFPNRSCHRPGEMIVGSAVVVSVDHL